MLPEGWKRVPLGEIAQITSGGTPDRATPSYWGGEIPWVTTGEIQFNTITDTTEKITEAGLKNSAAKLFPPGTLLIAMYGQGKTRGQVAKLGITAATNQNSAAILLKPEQDPNYYFHYFSWKYESIRELGNTGGLTHLNAGLLKQITVPQAPYAVQKKISLILESWEKAIKIAEKLIENSTTYKIALMNRFFSKHDSSHPMAGDWRSLTLGAMADIDAESLGRATPDDFQFRYITLSDINEYHVSQDLATYRLSEAPSRARRVVRPGDLLMSTVRPNLQGFARVTRAHVDCIASTGFAVLTAKSGTSSDYLFHYLFSKHIQDQINAIVTGSSYPSINSSDVERLLVRCPSLRQQQEIANILDTAEQRIRAEIRQRDLLVRQKQALMQQLLTGKRRVRMAECEVQA